MKLIRQAIGELFGSPVQNMTLVAYMQYVNTAGKITAKSLLDLTTVLLVFVEEQEKKIKAYEENFNQIEDILKKLVEEKVTPETPTPEEIEKILADANDLIPKSIKNPPELSIHPPVVPEANKSIDTTEFEKALSPEQLASLENKFVCKTCSKQFTSKRSVTAHMLSHKTK